MPKLFDDDVSDEDVKINTNTEYANKYNQWRKKEELYHLEQKYKSKLNSESDADSSSSDEELENIEESLEKSFFKTLSCLKNKDPKIYDENVVFFEENDSGDEEKVEKKPKKSKPLTIPEYERQLLLKQGNFSDEDEKEINPRVASPTYAEEQRRLQESLKKVVKEDDDGEEGWGGLFVKREKTKEEQEQEEADYRKWLKGQKDKLDDDADASELKPLRDYWNNPDLNESEAYLRDYLLNRRYLEKEDENRIPTYEEIVHDSDEGLSEDEKAIERQEEFEVKYNFRYEEPDQEFIKRYPRTMEHSVRKTDDRRKIKRAETKERKLEKKKEREEELKQLKMLKLSEIQERINKLKQITGNEEMAFQDNDIDGDFDPEAHDRRMQELFNDDYYGVGDEEKPEFPDLEEELGPWKDKNELNYDDENFNMDCDYDPTSKKSKKEKKKRNRPGKTPKKLDEEALENDENFKEFEDEYYNLDYEDMIGDIPCRFKYRKVVPNSFGLTIEEILLAKEQELNRWCSLKKVVQIRPEHIEKYDVFAYQKKARNEELKKKILPSLYADLQEEKIDDTEENGDGTSESTSKNKNETLKNNAEEKNFEHAQDEKLKKKQSKKKKNLDEHKETEEEKMITNNFEENNLKVSQVENPKKNNKKRKNSETHNNSDEKSIDDTPKKKKKYENDTNERKELTNEKDKPKEKSGKKKKKKKNLKKNSSVENEQNISNTLQSSPEKTNLSKENTQSNKEINTISRRQKKNEKRKLKKLNTSTEKSETILNEQKNKNDTKSNMKNKKKFKKKQNLNNTSASSGNDSNFEKNRKRKFSAQKTDAGQGNIPNKKMKFDKNQSVKDVKFSDARLEAYGINPKKFKNKMKYKKNL